MRQAAFERCKHKDKKTVAKIQYQVDGFTYLQSAVRPEAKSYINKCVIRLSTCLLISPLWFTWFYLCASGTVDFQHKKVVFGVGAIQQAQPMMQQPDMAMKQPGMAAISPMELQGA